MKKIIVLNILVLSACSQNQKVKLQQEAPKPPPIGNEMKSNKVDL